VPVDIPDFDDIDTGTTPLHHAPDSILIDWTTFWDNEHSDADWIAEPVLPAGRSVAIFAPGGTGKSLFALWTAAAIATGKPIFGRHQPPRHVLYLDYEMTADDLAERLNNMGYDADTNLNHLHYALLPSLPGLDTPEGGKTIIELAEQTSADIVIIDTFGRAVHGDENDADTVRNWYRWTGLNLKHAGRAFARIDHAGKDTEKGQRGTSAKNDDVDIVWQMTRGDNNTYTLKAKKRRMSWVPEKVEMYMTDSDLEVLDFRLLHGDAWPAGTAETAALLDELGIDITATVRTAETALRAAGQKRRSTIIRAAIRYRKQHTPLVGNLVDNPEMLRPDHRDAHHDTPNRTQHGTQRDAHPTQTTKPQVNTPKNASQQNGTHGTHERSVDGTQCASLGGTHCVPTPPDTDPNCPF
jgi:hypothetical protein